MRERERERKEIKTESVTPSQAQKSHKSDGVGLTAGTLFMITLEPSGTEKSSSSYTEFQKHKLIISKFQKSKIQKKIEKARLDVD